MGYLDQKKKLIGVEDVVLLMGSVYVFHVQLTTNLPQMVKDKIHDQIYCMSTYII